MRTLCDVCESAAAVLFCAADEAALCRNCDDKVHMCNKLASRHVRVGLADASQVPRCDICENSPAFFYCEIDGSSLCLQCDMIVHVGGKRTHRRYLTLRQRIEFPGNKPGILDEQGLRRAANLGEAKKEPQLISNNVESNNGKVENNLIDLNARPQRMHEQVTDNEEQMETLANNGHESESMVPDGYYKPEP